MDSDADYGSSSRPEVAAEMPTTTTTAAAVAAKTSVPATPVSGVFAIVKPSHMSSMSLLDALKPLLGASKLFQMPAEEAAGGERNGNNRNRQRGGWRKRKRGFNSGPSAPKVGQGGTLDPLADGVLVVGIGAGTKRLQGYLDCTKEYRTVGLLGASTLSYDSDDPILHRQPHTHVNADTIRSLLSHFKGKGTQLPPLYSAVKIDGKRLFDYAREGKDLPRPIQRRDIVVSRLELVAWQPAGEHRYVAASQECSDEERALAVRARRLAGLDEEEEAAAAAAAAPGDEEAQPNKIHGDERDVAPAAFTLDMTVSSGTYVRSIVHDVGVRARSAAYVVKLTRIRQGKWVTPDYNAPKQGGAMADLDASAEASEAPPPEHGTKVAIEWDVFQAAIDRLSASESEKRKRIAAKRLRDEQVQANRAEPTKDDEQEQEQGEAQEDGKECEQELALWERIVLERMDRC